MSHGKLPVKKCRKWLRWNPFLYKDEFRKRYAVFRFFDLNEDGKLSEHEFVGAFEKFFDGQVIGPDAFHNKLKMYSK